MGARQGGHDGLQSPCLFRLTVDFGASMSNAPMLMRVNWRLSPMASSTDAAASGCPY